jgi:hypothetical protein
MWGGSGDVPVKVEGNGARQITSSAPRPLLQRQLREFGSETDEVPTAAGAASEPPLASPTAPRAEPRSIDRRAPPLDRGITGPQDEGRAAPGEAGRPPQVDLLERHSREEQGEPDVRPEGSAPHDPQYEQGGAGQEERMVREEGDPQEPRVVPEAARRIPGRTRGIGRRPGHAGKLLPRLRRRGYPTRPPPPSGGRTCSVEGRRAPGPRSSIGRYYPLADRPNRRPR